MEFHVAYHSLNLEQNVCARARVLRIIRMVSHVLIYALSLG